MGIAEDLETEIKNMSKQKKEKADELKEINQNIKNREKALALITGKKKKKKEATKDETPD
jgi:hypothetical protein